MQEDGVPIFIMLLVSAVMVIGALGALMFVVVIVGNVLLTGMGG